MKKKNSWLFVDLVEDKIKSRGIFITVSLLFYVYLTWKFILSGADRDVTPVRIESSLDFSRMAYVGQDVSETLSPQVKVVNKQGQAVAGVNVTISVVKLSTDTEKRTGPICDSDYRSAMRGSLEYIRFHDVCSVTLKGHVETTDEKGNAYFKRFQIERGPEALYSLQYSVEIDKYTTVTSEIFNSYLSSKIYKLDSLNTYSLLNDNHFIDIPFRAQPQIKITDVKGQPIVGKRVMAFTWVDQLFDLNLADTSMAHNLKFMTMENILSEPSNEEGIAIFNNLSMKGSNNLVAYIHFYAEGVSTPWTNRLMDFNFERSVLPPRAIYPFIVTYPDIYLSIVNDQHRTVVEGHQLDLPFTIVAHDNESLKPVAGVL